MRVLAALLCVLVATTATAVDVPVAAKRLVLNDGPWWTTRRIYRARGR